MHHPALVRPVAEPTSCAWCRDLERVRDDLRARRRAGTIGDIEYADEMMALATTRRDRVLARVDAGAIHPEDTGVASVQSEYRLAVRGLVEVEAAKRDGKVKPQPIVFAYSPHSEATIKAALAELEAGNDDGGGDA